MNQHSIYALCEPGTLDVRYVGRTSQSLSKRLSNHLTNSNPRWSYRQPALAEWIISLRERGARPGIVLLTAIPDRKVAKKAEWQWIALFADNGCNLLNVFGMPKAARFDRMVAMASNGGLHEAA